MADDPQLNVSPECVSNENMKCQEENTSAQAHEVGPANGYSELSKQKVGGCDVLQNELQEICIVSNDADNQSQEFRNVTEKSQPEQEGLTPEVVRNSSQGGVDLPANSANGYQFGSVHVQNGLLQTTTELSGFTTSGHLRPDFCNVIENFFGEPLRLPPEDPGVNCQTGKSTCSEQISLEQINVVGFGTSSNETREEKQHVGFDNVQDELLQTSIPVSSCGSEQLQLISESVSMTCPNGQDRAPPEDVSKALESTHNFCFGTSTYVLSEDKQHFGLDITRNKVLQNQYWTDTISLEVPSCDGNEPLQSFCEKVETGSLDEQAGLSNEDVNKTLRQKNDVSSETSYGRPTEENQNTGAYFLQDEPVQTIILGPSSGADEQLAVVNENVSMPSPGKQAPLQTIILGPSSGADEQLEEANENVSVPSPGKQAALQTIILGPSSGADEQLEEANENVSVPSPGKQAPLQTIILGPSSGEDEQLEEANENVSEPSPGKQAGQPPEAVSKTHQADELSCSLQNASDKIDEDCCGSAQCELQEQRDQHGSLPSQNDQDKKCTAVSSSAGFGQLGPSVEEIISSVISNLESPPESKDHTDELIKPHVNDATQNSYLESSEALPKNASKISTQLDSKDKQNSSSRRKSITLASSDRVLRSRTSEKSETPESINIVTTLDKSTSVVNVSNEKEGKLKKRKKKHRERVAADEFTRIRSHLRYSLNRINYEKSLIDAYSGEGWKGNSLEKLKPEKELQRATSEILRRKSKIRDLFQRLDSLSAEGMFPDSIFDEEGQIDSEDIFCAKCGSLDVYAGNDIILCDGACDRGFHQRCLEPPLLSEDIPPDDEGWLCPCCNCKVDCIDLLNDSQGTDLAISDSWEKVYPEAAVVASSGHHQENNQGLPSDDSDDNDYDPNGPESDEEVQETESSSDESESSASDERETPKTNDDKYLGLPSDDSEDDDFNPGDPDPAEAVKQDSSSSDFTSDSEDLAAVIDEDSKSFENGGRSQTSLLEASTLIRGSSGTGSKRGQKRHSIKDEGSSLIESDPDQDSPALVSGKRRVERLDYKKLHDEEYGDIPTSEDEDYIETAEPRKRKKGDGQVSLESLKGKPSRIREGITPKYIQDDPGKSDHTPRRTPGRKSNAQDNSSSPVEPLKRSPKSEHTPRRTPRLKSTAQDNSNTPIEPPKISSKSEHTPRRTPRLKLTAQDNSNSPNESHKSPPKSGVTSGQSKGSTDRRLGQAVTQRLYTSFKENNYPDRSMKERLAQELGITAKQVSKWFGNARHSVKAGIALPHVMRTQPDQAETGVKDADNHGAQKNESPATDAAVAVSCSRDMKDNKSATPKSITPKTTIPRGNKRKLRSNSRGCDVEEEIKTPPETSSKGGRVTRQRKSV